MFSLKFIKAAIAATPGTTLAQLFTEIVTAVESATVSAVTTYLPQIEALAFQYVEAFVSGNSTLTAIYAEIVALLAKLAPAS